MLVLLRYSYKICYTAFSVICDSIKLVDYVLGNVQWPTQDIKILKLQERARGLELRSLSVTYRGVYSSDIIFSIGRVYSSDISFSVGKN